MPPMMPMGGNPNTMGGMSPSSGVINANIPPGGAPNTILPVQYAGFAKAPTLEFLQKWLASPPTKREDCKGSEGDRSTSTPPTTPPTTHPSPTGSSTSVFGDQAGSSSSPLIWIIVGLVGAGVVAAAVAGPIMRRFRP